MQIFLIVVIIALAAGLVWVYRKGLQDGLKISNLKDKPEPAAVERAFNGPKKPAPPDPRIVEEQRKRDILLANLDAYDGTERGQKDVK